MKMIAAISDDRELERLLTHLGASADFRPHPREWMGRPLPVVWKGAEDDAVAVAAEVPRR